ncbi:MAG: hemolysin family protein [Erysipelotrichaceae bacterium]
MDVDQIIFSIILQLVLILLNAIFACAEIAVLSVNDNRINKLVNENNNKAKRIQKLTENPAKFLSTIQVAITLSGFMGSAFAADNFSKPIVNMLLSWGVQIPAATLSTLSVIVITLILSYFTLIFGELVPKRLAMKNPEKISLALSGIVGAISFFFKPIVAFLTVSTNGILRLLGVDPNEVEEDVTEEEIIMMVDAGSEKGTIDLDEQTFIKNIFEFDDITVEEICTHRTDMAMLWMDDDMDEWNKIIHDNRHSLYPVCSDSVDNIVGVLDVKTYFRLEDKSRENVVIRAIKKAQFVPETLKADMLFQSMKKSGNYFALVLDEYGGLSGLVTMNDLIEQLVGDLVEEDDLKVQPSIIKINDTTYSIIGNIEIEELNEKLNLTIPAEEFETFSGLVFDTIGNIPEDGTQFEIQFDNILIKIIELKEHRVEKATIYLLPEEDKTNVEKEKQKG